jgi:predicted transcriptional regulator
MLTPLELDIMKVIWRQPSITVRDVQSALRPGRKLAYTTVMTIMNRLFVKGFLSRTLRSRTHLYEPTVPFAEVRDAALNGLIDSFFGGSRESLQEFLGVDGISRTEKSVPAQQHLPVSPALFDETLL